MKRIPVLSGGLLAVLAACAAFGGAPSPAGDAAALYKTLRQASVFVLVDGRHTGSGFFAGPDGLVVTSAHMVKRKTRGIEVVSPVAGRLGAERVAIDLAHDLALLRVPKRDQPYPTLPIAERIPPPGTKIFLFGDPVFRHRLLLTGFVALAEPTYCHSGGLQCYTRVFYVAGASPNGTSGGCWADSTGRVVGVQSAYLNIRANTPAGIASASPPDAIRTLLATKRSTEPATLAARLDELWTQPKGFIARFPEGTTGIVTVVPGKGTPVAKAGLNKESLITAIDGKPVAYIDDLMTAVRAKKPGDQVTLEVLPPDRKPKRTVTLRLAKLQE